MVGWHNAVGSAPQANVWTDGDNVIAFSRGNRGWAAFNNNATPQTITVQTGLPRGRYCDVVHSTPTGGQCSDGLAPVQVAPDGTATVTIPAFDAVAVDRPSKL
jgi:alpha-amylase